jgi:hypothetical protein
MDDDLKRWFNRGISDRMTDGEAGARHPADPGWSGTGLCPEAQADGIPCHEVGRDCETCGRAAPAYPSRRRAIRSRRRAV